MGLALALALGVGGNEGSDAGSGGSLVNPAETMAGTANVVPGGISGLALWLDASRGFVANTSWTDQIASAVFNYTAGVGTMIAGTGINGHATVDFTLGGYLSSTAALSTIVSAGHNASTTLIIWRYTGLIVDSGTPYTNPGILTDTGGYFWQTCSTTKFHNGVYHASTQDDSTTTTTSTNYYTLSLYDAAVDGKIYTSLNGGALDAGVAAGSLGSAAGTLLVGADYAKTTTLTFVGSVQHILVWNRALTSGEQTSVNAWAHSVSGI